MTDPRINQDGVDDLLRQWGIWAFDGRGAAFGYGKNILAPPSAPRSHYLSDDEALAIDRSISALRTLNEDMGDCLAIYYLGHTIRDVARIHGCTKSKAAALIEQGRVWIWGYWFALAGHH